MKSPLRSLQFDELQAVYDGVALNQPISARVQPGRWLFIQGHSGYGKSSLLRAALGFNESIRGRILVNEKVLTPNSAKCLRANSGYLPQRPHLGEGTLELLARDLLPQADKLMPDAQRLSRELDLPERVWSTPAEMLSGGELQRATLSLLLCRQPEMLFLDEPSAALDGFSRRKLIDLLKKLNIGGVIVSHDEILVEELADETIELQEATRQEQSS